MHCSHASISICVLCVAKLIFSGGWRHRSVVISPVDVARGITDLLVVFIYSCPTTSPVRYRMLYSSAALSTYLAVKDFFAETGSTFPLATKRIETSDQTELNEAFLKAGLNLDGPVGTITNNNSARQDDPAKPSFARPRGPARRR